MVRWCDGQDEPLDILVNHAAQSLRHPPDAYAALSAGPLPEGALELAGVVDSAGLLPDRSADNSWTRLVQQVDPIELLEVQLINVTSPAVPAASRRTPPPAGAVPPITPPACRRD